MKILRFLMVLLFLEGQCFALSSTSVDGGLGAGYEDNLNHAGSSGSREGDTFASAWLQGGVRKEALKNHSLFLNVAYGGSYFQEYDDLTVHSFSLKTGLMLDTGSSFLITLSPGASKSIYGDSDRDADETSLSLSLSSVLSTLITARAAYEHINHVAKESLFSYEADTLSAGLEFQLSNDALLGLSYALEESETVFYIDSASPMPLKGKSGHSGTFSSTQLAIREDTTTHIISIDMDYHLPQSIYFLFSYNYYWTESDLEDFQNNRTFAAIGTHF